MRFITILCLGLLHTGSSFAGHTPVNKSNRSPHERKTIQTRPKSDTGDQNLNRMSATKLPHPASRMEQILLRNQLSGTALYTAKKNPVPVKDYRRSTSAKEMVKTAQAEMRLDRKYMDPLYKKVVIELNDGSKKSLSIESIQSIEVAYIGPKIQRLDIVEDAPRVVNGIVKDRTFLFQPNRSEVKTLTFMTEDGKQKSVTLDELFTFKN